MRRSTIGDMMIRQRTLLRRHLWRSEGCALVTTGCQMGSAIAGSRSPAGDYRFQGMIRNTDMRKKKVRTASAVNGRTEPRFGASGCGLAGTAPVQVKRYKA